MDLQYRSVFGQLSWQNGDLPWRTPTYKVKWPLDHVVLQNYVTNCDHYISTTIVLIATKVGRLVRYLEGILPLMYHDSWVMRPYEITWETNYISPLPQHLFPPNLAEWWHNLRGSEIQSLTALKSRVLARSQDK